MEEGFDKFLQSENDKRHKFTSELSQIANIEALKEVLGSKELSGNAVLFVTEDNDIGTEDVERKSETRLS